MVKTKSPNINRD